MNRSVFLGLATIVAVTVAGGMISCGGGGSGGGGAAPPAGTLDTSFGTDGVVLVDQTDIDFSYDITTDSTGRIFAAGHTGTSSSSQMAVWCLDDNGNLDTSFGTGGTATGPGDSGYGVAVDTSDRVVVVGRAFGLDMAVWRFDTDGTLDASFASSGMMSHDGAAWAGSGPGHYDRAFKVAVEGSGRIITAGESRNEFGDDDMVVWSIMDGGFLDYSFGGDFSPADGISDGFAVHNGAASTGTTSSDNGYDMGLDSLGRIVVGGKSEDQTYNPHQTIWRYNSDGTLDTTFGGDFNPLDGTPDGFTVYPDPSNSETIAIDSSDRIIAAGVNNSAATTAQGMAIWRYNTGGVLDTTFGGDVAPADGVPDGFTVFNSFIVMPTAVAVDQMDRVLLAGFVIQASEWDMVLFRFNSSGVLDTSFGGDVSPSDGTPDGFVIIDNNPLTINDNDLGRSIHIDNSGRILVTGGVAVGLNSSIMAVWRFNP